MQKKKKKIQEEQSMKIVNKDRTSITHFFLLPQAQMWLRIGTEDGSCSLGRQADWMLQCCVYCI